MLKVLYIDDEITKPHREARKIQELLHEPGEFECDLRLPPRTFAGLPKEQFDALLVDLDLSTAQVEGENISYYGSTLASEFRMRNPSCPIVLVTRPQVMGWQEQLLEESIDVDLILMKEDINRVPQVERAKIVALIQGFRRLSDIANQPWDEVVAATGATGSEAALLREAAPPIVHGQWNVPQVARWLRNVVMGYPGILYDELTAATRLGIDVESFRMPAVQAFFRTAAYDGVFSTYKRRFWRERLFELAHQLTGVHGLIRPVSQQFAVAWRENFGELLKPAVCVSDGTPTADWVCYILQKPVKQRNSLPYYPDQRPPVMDQARVSFKAIVESPDFDETLIDADGKSTVSELWSLPAR